jgi:hypothetical protein
MQVCPRVGYQVRKKAENMADYISSDRRNVTIGGKSDTKEE